MLLTVKNLTKKFNHKIVVDKINLEIKAGELVAFLGPNGAGKSTTINMLTGIIQPTSGSVELDGLKPNNSRYHQQIGVVFQQSVLDDDLTVKQNMISRQKMYQVSTEDLNFWIDKFALGKILNQKYRVLSGGQKRRVDIVRALIHDPKILFLDEPTTGLDIQTRNLIWDILNNLRVEKGLTIVLTTHYLEEAELADFVYVIDHGQVIAADTVNNLKTKFAQNVLTIYPKDMRHLPSVISDYQYQVKDEEISIFLEQHAAVGLLDVLQNEIKDFEYRRGNMDDIFVSLTGKGVE